MRMAGQRIAANYQARFYLALVSIWNGVHVNSALISQVEEDIRSILGSLAALLEAKNEVNPFMQVVRHEVALQSLSLYSYKFLWAALSPGRKDNIGQVWPVLHMKP